MEDIHGVDVSWLHHANRDKHIRLLSSNASTGQTNRASTPTSLANRKPQYDQPAPASSPAESPAPSAPRNIPAPAADTLATSPSAASTLAKGTSPKRPSLIGKASNDKATSQVSTDTAKGASPRRNSWISNISSKLSSQPAVNNPKTQKAPPVAVSAPATNGHAQRPSTPKEEAEPSPPPPTSKTGNTSFFSNALRRLSSNSGTGYGKSVPNGGLCPRRVMNIDHNRPRCLLPELDQSKLRKVAFCVDVEIAGGPRYKDEPDEAEKKKKNRDVKLKEKGEGEALKHPKAVMDEKDANGVVETPCGNENVGTEEQPNPQGTVEDEKKDMSRKKEKKKKSEEERKERKEQRRKKAEENGSLPVQIVRDSDESGNPTPVQTPRPKDRPTTDPLRIYRRCCQLRESPILKRITEQLAKPTICPADTPGVVSVLDLTGSRLQFADVVTLSDWLAVVPVKKLILEDSDLTDEGIRVIMAGLLAVRSTDYFTRRGLTHPVTNGAPNEEKLGCVEKLSLKNNPKIGKAGWKHISLFVYMCSSLKALDVSMITFPPFTDVGLGPDGASRPNTCDPAEVFSKAISERLGGDILEELVMAECSLSSQAIRKIVDGVAISGLKRLGLAGNRLDRDGLGHVIRYLRSGVCHGLDLGSNDLREIISDLAEGMPDNSKFWALCLADCNLTPAALKPLFPALLKLKEFRFLDLSHNHDLFSSQPSALGLLRKYIPCMTMLKRIHLMDVGMTSAQAIALAEILPENPTLAHINLLQNPQLSALASATDVATQEEACALYASLMIAARVSHTLICVDIDVPTSDNSELVKSIAKQVVAYCLRNMEQFAATELPDDGSIPSGEKHDHHGEPPIPEILLHLIGNKEDQYEQHPEEAANENYIVGGAAVAKALSYCLSEKASEVRAGSIPTSGTVTPGEPQEGNGLAATKAKEWSKDLLDSARKIRIRLQPAMIKEARAGDDMAYRRLLFLDNTLQGMIQRFEEEYPDCRPSSTSQASGTADFSCHNDDAASSISSHSITEPSILTHSDSLSNGTTLQGNDSDEDFADARSRFSRRSSDISLASRAQAKEEGQIHRLTQRVKLEVLKPVGLDPNSQPSLSILDPETEPEHLKILKAKLEAVSAEKFLELVRGEGWEKAAKGVLDQGAFLRNLEREDPAELGRIRDKMVKEGLMEPLEDGLIMKKTNSGDESAIVED